VNEWINIVTQACIDDLKKLCQNFKYIVTCYIRQRKGAGMETCSVAYWDEKSDGACTVSWENTSMSVVIYVYGLAI
jgi:dynein light chain Tctex-type 1